MKRRHPAELYALCTDRRPSWNFLVVAASPERAIAKLKKQGKDLLDRGEKITDVKHEGTIDIF